MYFWKVLSSNPSSALRGNCSGAYFLILKDTLVSGFLIRSIIHMPTSPQVPSKVELSLEAAAQVETLFPSSPQLVDEAFAWFSLMGQSREACVVAFLLAGCRTR